MAQPQVQTWSFLTNHALVLVFVIRQPDSTVRQIAEGVRITERATLAILRQLSDDRIVERRRDGRAGQRGDLARASRTARWCRRGARRSSRRTGDAASSGR